ncbi:MAG: hypothetical protein R2744_02200 [Bacteroidales bacterium]
MFTANRQTNPENIGKVASGGELSRVMLSLKSLLSDAVTFRPSFSMRLMQVFPVRLLQGWEVLTGMGRRMQVINITHLPQVAALGSGTTMFTKKMTGSQPYPY